MGLVLNGTPALANKLTLAERPASLRKPACLDPETLDHSTKKYMVVLKNV